MYCEKCKKEQEFELDDNSGVRHCSECGYGKTEKDFISDVSHSGSDSGSQEDWKTLSNISFILKMPS